MHRKSSGTIIVPRDAPDIEIKDEEYDEGDARAMSPRRSSEELDRLEECARQALVEYVLHIATAIQRLLTSPSDKPSNSKLLFSVSSNASNPSKQNMRSSKVETGFYNRKSLEFRLRPQAWLTWCRYIGELMQTSKITATSAAKGKGKGRISK